MTANILSFDPVQYAETTEKLRSKEVSADNQRTIWGRETLCGLFSGAMNKGDLTAALLSALKPVKPNGKPGDTLSSLRYAPGGEAIRKAADLCLAIFEAATDGRIAAEFRPVAVGFATDAPDAPRKLYGLRDVMADMRRAAAKADKEAAGISDEGESESESESEGEAPATPLATIIARATLAIAESDDDAFLAADDAVAALMEAIRERFSREATAPVAQAA